MNEDEFLFKSQQNIQEKQISENNIFPKKITKSLGVKLNSTAALVMDRKSDKILFEKESNKKLPPASLTKIMTALVTLESKANLDDIVIIKKNSVDTEGSNIGLKIGEEITLQDLLYGVLVSSGNDAALALAEFTSGDIESFVLQMNKKAVELKLNNTHFVNVTGLDTEGHYSTAYDIARLLDYALENSFFKQIISTKEYEIISEPNITHHLKNTNQLLLDDYPKIGGGKTGFTDEAGFCLAALAKNDGNEIIIVVLGSQKNGHQFQDVKALTDWTFKTFEW